MKSMQMPTGSCKLLAARRYVYMPNSTSSACAAARRDACPQSALRLQAAMREARQTPTAQCGTRQLRLATCEPVTPKADAPSLPADHSAAAERSAAQLTRLRLEGSAPPERSVAGRWPEGPAWSLPSGGVRVRIAASPADSPTALSCRAGCLLRSPSTRGWKRYCTRPPTRCAVASSGSTLSVPAAYTAQGM